MLANIYEVGSLPGLARRKRRPDEYKTVRHALVSSEQTAGWAVARKNRATTRLARPKSHDVLLEDEVWFMLYRMGFTHLSGAGGAVISATADGSGPTNQLDVVALDDEVGLVVECKSSETPKRLAGFSESIGKLVATRETFIKDVRKQFPTERKRQVKYAYFLANFQLSENDQERAMQQGVAIFELSDLKYYKELVSQIGPAARFQFLADLLPGRSIPGLELTVPAVRAKMGGYRCYTFNVSPRYLLKIAYVSHRAKGKPSDVDTYQRMIKKSRLTKIREYIEDDGIFPTNIVVNFKKNSFDFQRAKQEGADGSDSTFGWLRLTPSYKSAWIIDGQHRLFAYAGHSLAARSLVAVLAFEGLPPSEQARLFIDINAEQKKVKQSLLQELYAELNWDSEDPEERVRAVLSKTIQALDVCPDSPFRGRILKADERRTDQRCITLTALFGALGKTGFFIERMSKGAVVQYGPLWAGTIDATLKRTVRLMSAWYDTIRAGAETRWNLGQARGGGLAMNDGVTVCANVLRSVLEHLQGRGIKLAAMSDEELVKVLTPYGQAVGRYFTSLSDEEMERFRSSRGVQGQTSGTRRVQQQLKMEFEQFNPPGLEEFLDQEKAQTNRKAYDVLTEIERTLQRTIVDELKREFISDDEAWWYSGVPVAVRKKVTERIEEAQGKEGGREENLDLVDYRAIIVHQGNWTLFKEVLANEGGKDKGTKWITDVNELRRIVMHASKGLHLPVTTEQLACLEERLAWLRSRTSCADA